MSLQRHLPFESASAYQPGRFPVGGKTHDFGTSLALSNSYTDAPWWMDIYRRAFPP